MVTIAPVDVPVGAAEPQGSTNISQVVANPPAGFAGCVQPKVAVYGVIPVTVCVIGVEQVGKVVKLLVAAQILVVVALHTVRI